MNLPYQPSDSFQINPSVEELIKDKFFELFSEFFESQRKTIMSSIAGELWGHEVANIAFSDSITSEEFSTLALSDLVSDYIDLYDVHHLEIQPDLYERTSKLAADFEKQAALLRAHAEKLKAAE
jgi:hypothetical protein